MILWPKNQEIFFSKNIQKIETFYLIRLVSGSLGEPMSWAPMSWKNSIWKPNPIEPTPMGWSGTLFKTQPNGHPISDSINQNVNNVNFNTTFKVAWIEFLRLEEITYIFMKHEKFFFSMT
jgi:hypothetical protein